MFSTGNLTFIGELIAAQIIFLYSYPQRKKFILRSAGAVAACLLLAYFFPMPDGIKFNVYYTLFRFLVLFGYTFAAACLCFDCKCGAVLVACVGGYALQHTAYHVYTLFSLIEGVPNAQWVEIIVCCVIYIAVFFTLGRFVAKKCFYNFYSKSMLAVSAATIVICIGLSRFARLSHGGGDIIVICTSLYAITCCLLVLLLQYYIYSFTMTRAEKETLQRIREEEKKQYGISKANIDRKSVV